MSKKVQRPTFEEIKSGSEFNRWYWLKEELIDICKQSGLPHSGGKFELRDRISYALDNDGQLLKKQKQTKTSNFNWAKAILGPETIITDNITFGPNFRNFMKKEIGNRFSCHSDFMDWVKSNTGKTLQDAADQWIVLEKRKQDPDFKREIADHNMYAQYTRDFLEDNPGMTLKDACKYWLLKRQLPTETGFIKYDPRDLNL